MFKKNDKKRVEDNIKNLKMKVYCTSSYVKEGEINIPKQELSEVAELPEKDLVSENDEVLKEEGFKPKKKKKKRFVIVLIFLILLGLFGYGYYYYLFKLDLTSAPERVRISNKTDTGFSISWITPEKQTKGGVYVLKDKSIRIPYVSETFLTENYDVRDLISKEKVTQNSKGKYTTHFVNIDGLDPNTEYKVLIKVGNVSYALDKNSRDISKVQTFSSVSKPLVPAIVYGNVKFKDKELGGGIVFLRMLNEEGHESNLLSSITNASGGYSIDYANARNLITQEAYKYENLEKLVMVDGGDVGRGMIDIEDGLDQPVTDILLNKVDGDVSSISSRFMKGSTIYEIIPNKTAYNLTTELIDIEEFVSFSISDSSAINFPLLLSDSKLCLGNKSWEECPTDFSMSESLVEILPERMLNQKLELKTEAIKPKEMDVALKDKKLEDEVSAEEQALITQNEKIQQDINLEKNATSQNHCGGKGLNYDYATTKCLSGNGPVFLNTGTKEIFPAIGFYDKKQNYAYDKTKNILHTVSKDIKSEEIESKILLNELYEDGTISHVIGEVGSTGFITFKSNISKGSKVSINLPMLNGVHYVIDTFTELNPKDVIMIPVKIFGDKLTSPSSAVPERNDTTINASFDAGGRNITIGFYADANESGTFDESENFIVLKSLEVELMDDSITESIDLFEGANSISLPLNVEGLTASTFLKEVASQGGYASSISKFDGGRWLTYSVRGNHNYAYNDFNLTTGVGYMVNVIKPVNVILAGNYPVDPVGIKLNNGMNFVAFHPGYTINNEIAWAHQVPEGKWNAESVLLDLNADGIGANSTGKYRGSDFLEYNLNDQTGSGIDFEVELTKGYFVNVAGIKEGIVWTP